MIQEGSKLGPYEIVAEIGAGGMGAVYKARDTRLGRTVAIKVLKPEAQPESERLRREAKAISRLAHPNICGLFDIGSDGGLDFLVMEYLEGVPLDERLKSGPLSRADFFQYAIAIAGAMDHAHRNGVVHRDLKPSNLIVTSTGVVKLLDFGLAALRRPAAAAGGETTVTVESDLTKPGTVVGTPRYMSPEQLLGKEADARSDIFAFGAVLFEMATARKAFAGKEWSEIAAAILTGPQPSLGPAADPGLDRLIGKCLAKNPDDRWQTARDLKSELEWLVTRAEQRATSTRRLRGLPWVVAAVLAGALLVIGSRRWFAPESKPPRAVHVAIAIPEEGAALDPGRVSGAPSISPDGKTVVAPLGTGSAAALWLRRLDADKFERLPGTEGGAQPFWSPDGRQIGFFAAGSLKKMPIDGSAPQVVCAAAAGSSRGGAWNASGTILFGINYEGLRRVSERGGESVLVAGLDKKLNENSLRFPVFLPDGNRFLYFSRTARLEDAGTYLDALDAAGKRPRKKIATTEGPASLGHDPVSGRSYLLFPRSGRLWAQHFDLDRGEVDGEPAAISEDVGQFSLSGTGTLVFRRLGSEITKLTWFDHAGKSLGDVGKPGDYWAVALSPDDRRVAVVDHRSVDGHFWVSIIDLARNLQTQFSDPAEFSFSPVWSRDGTRVSFFSARRGKLQLFGKSVDDAGSEQALVTLTDTIRLCDLSPDGKTFLGVRWRDSERLLGAMTVGQADWRPILETKAHLQAGQFSPDGKQIAYQSDESGVNEIYVTDFPSARHKQRLSTAGGTEPRWRHDGKELYYVAPDNTLMSVAIAGTSAPAKVFKAQLHPATDDFRYAVARDGRFLIVSGSVDPASRDLSIVFNWPQLLREK